VTRLRYVLNRIGVSEPTMFTAHSAKATVLSWSAQLDIDSTKRARQGHHQKEHTVTLYGRDDVFLALKLQEIVLRAIRSGWRPMRAQRRGAAPPAAEKEVQLDADALEEGEFAPGFRVNFQPMASCSLSDLLVECTAMDSQAEDGGHRLPPAQLKVGQLLGLFSCLSLLPLFIPGSCGALQQRSQES
jgi:hypothetical protein